MRCTEQGGERNSEIFTPPLFWRFSRQNVGDTYMKFVYNDQFYYLASNDWNKSCLFKRN